MSDSKPAAWRHRLTTIEGSTSGWLLTDTPHSGLWPSGSKIEGFEQEPLYAEDEENGAPHTCDSCRFYREIIADKTLAYKTLREAFDLRTVEMADAGRRQAFIEAAEIAEEYDDHQKVLTVPKHIALIIRAKAEGTQG